MTGPQEHTASFEASRDCFEEALAWLAEPDTRELSHGDLEDQLDRRGKELMRRMYQDHLDLRAVTESRLSDVVDVEDVTHGALEAGHRRPLKVIFGGVEVERFAYRHRGHANLYPADGLLNLPAEQHSHGLRRLAAIEASRGSFEEAADAVQRATGVSIGKRQVEALAARASVDVEEFYATRDKPEADTSDVLVISADGKGIVMRRTQSSCSARHCRPTRPALACI